MKFRKKPVVIDAIQYTGSVQSLTDIVGWTAESTSPARVQRGKCTKENPQGFDFPELVIHTLEGDMLVTEGDWVIRGVNGEHYPCKPDIFAATYEAVES